MAKEVVVNRAQVLVNIKNVATEWTFHDVSKGWDGVCEKLSSFTFNFLGIPEDASNVFLSVKVEINPFALNEPIDEYTFSMRIKSTLGEEFEFEFEPQEAKEVYVLMCKRNKDSAASVEQQDAFKSLQAPDLRSQS